VYEDSQAAQKAGYARTEKITEIVGQMIELARRLPDFDFPKRAQEPSDRSARRSVWSVIRDFNRYPVWVEGINESHIEDGKAGDAVGAIRNFSSGDTRIRQRLLAHSDLDRSYTFESCEPLAAITYYQVTGQVTPIVDGNRAFVEWSRFLIVPRRNEKLRWLVCGGNTAVAEFAPGQAGTDGQGVAPQPLAASMRA
jgi:hypothetical protein